jgi:hypothetical protein
VLGKLGDEIIWGGSDPFTHMLCVGPTRCGKTATILEPMIFQLLVQKKRGKKLGLSIIEPKGDLAQKVKEYCEGMEIPYIYIDPDSENSHRFNVMEGNTDDVAEATVAVLQSLFGKQEAFFQTVQELSARNITKLLKELHGDNMDLLDVLITLRSPQILEKKVSELKQKQGQTELVDFFENELLGSLGEKYRQLVIGLRAQLENITGNAKLKKIITGKSDINIDKHFEEGGVLIVNTALGTLKKAGDAFGQFVTMHLQSGTFRRKGTEQTRTAHFMIIDEYSRYINPDVEMFLSIAASYRVAGIFATQSLGQLEVESGKIGPKAMKQAILTSCRNKIAFGGLSAQDAKEFAEEFGMDQIIMRQTTYRNRILLPNFFPDSYRDTESEEYRFHYTYLQDNMNRFHFIARVLKDGTPQKPMEGIGQFVPRDWEGQRVWEKGIDEKSKWIQIFKLLKGLKGLVKKQAGKREQVLDAVPPNQPKHSKENFVEVVAETEEENEIIETKAISNRPLLDRGPADLDDGQNETHLGRELVIEAAAPLSNIQKERDLVIKKADKMPVMVFEEPTEPKKELVAAFNVTRDKVNDEQNNTENVYNDDDFW